MVSAVRCVAWGELYSSVIYVLLLLPCSWAAQLEIGKYPQYSYRAVFLTVLLSITRSYGASRLQGRPQEDLLLLLYV